MRSPPRDRQIRDALSEEMNFAVVVASQAVKQFGESPLGAVAAIEKWRDYGKTQVSGTREEKFADVEKYRRAARRA
jgi:hypothetical protein